MKPGIKIGILGGGQLAQMLILQGHRMGLQMHCLCEKETEPAALVTRHWHQGSTQDLETIQAFCGKMDFMTFESEFIPSDILKILEKEDATEIFPPPKTLRLLQDRLSQKELLLEYKIPTSPFVSFDDEESLTDAFLYFEKSCVAKKRLGGYDGKGTFILQSSAQLKAFLENQNLESHEFIVEAFVPFRRELALQVARNRQGQVLFLPLVEIHQEHNRLDWLVGPVKHPGLVSLRKKIQKFLNAIEYVGVIAFEIFDMGPDLIVNEIAPRVHNSGHYTLEGLNFDQFTLHLLAALDQPWPKIEARSKAFAMTNLIGKNSATVEFPKTLQGHLHWYGKLTNSEGRKMGHVTYLGNSGKSLVSSALKERQRMKL